MTQQKAIQTALRCGFSHSGLFQTDRLVFLPEVREMCESNRCGRFNSCWSCPPACGTLDQIREQVKLYPWGILLQSTKNLEDEFDGETMMEAGEEQKKRLEVFCSALTEEGETTFLVMGSGSCTICGACTWPDAPCRFPDRMVVSMEAYGLMVSDVCKLANLPYYYGPLTITYSSCVLFESHKEEK